MHMIAHGGVGGGSADTVRESALKVVSGRKIHCCTGESNLHQQHAGPTLYQLSYIPAQLAIPYRYFCSKKKRKKSNKLSFLESKIFIPADDACSQKTENQCSKF